MAGSFDEVMTALDPAMVVVTAALDGERSGCLVGFHAQCSIDPPQIALWISKVNHTFPIATRAEHLGVHFLSDGDHDLAALFGGNTGDDVDKFAGCDIVDGPDGVPMLTAVRHRVVGRRVATLDASGDHACVMVEPVDVHADGPLAPLRLHAVDDIDAGHPAEEASA